MKTPTRHRFTGVRIFRFMPNLDLPRRRRACVDQPPLDGPGGMLVQNGFGPAGAWPAELGAAQPATRWESALDNSPAGELDLEPGLHGARRHLVSARALDRGSPHLSSSV